MSFLMQRFTGPGVRGLPWGEETKTLALPPSCPPPQLTSSAVKGFLSYTYNFVSPAHQAWLEVQGQPTLVQSSYSQIQTLCNRNFVSFDIFQKTAVVK